MAIKHLRNHTLSAVASSADFIAFCGRYGALRFYSSSADLASFEALFRAKAHKYGNGMSSDAVETYLTAMRGRDCPLLSGTVGGTTLEGALIPTGGA